MNGRVRVIGWCIAAALLTGAPATAVGAGHPAGVIGQFTLAGDQLFQATGQPYDVAATPSGTAYIAWLSGTSTQSRRVVQLCTLDVSSTSCSGGIQTTDSLAFASGDDPLVVVTSDDTAHVIWWHDTGPGTAALAEATAPHGQGLSAGHDVASLSSSVGTLMAARLGPADSIWTVTYDGVPAQHVEVRPGLGAVAESVATPFAVGFAQLAFVGGQAVMTVEKYGDISTPPYYATRSSSGAWSDFKPVAGTWASGAAAALTTTGHGLRIITGVGNASYRPVVAGWNGSGFGKPLLTPDKNGCGVKTHDGWADPSQRLLDVSWECSDLAVANYPDAIHPALFRLKQSATPTYVAQVASGTRGIATLVYTVENGTANDLNVAHVLLPDSTRTVAKRSSAGRVTVTGPRSCLPPVNVHVGWTHRAARSWRFAAGSLRLGAAAVGGTLDGAVLTPGKQYTLTGTAVFSKAGARRSVTATLKFRSCAAA